MRITIEHNGKVKEMDADSVKAILPIEESPTVLVERHISLSSEGVIVDIVEDGEVSKTACYEHDDLI
jgi:hypothetical protein